MKSTRYKTTLCGLAITGAVPVFQHPLHVGSPNIGDEDVLFERLRTILRTRVLTNNGPFVQELERTICERLNVKHCIAVCNATTALEIAARSLAINGEVLLPSFTFIATANALTWHGAKPVFCDIRSDNHLIDISMLERAITSATQAIIPVNLWGNSCDRSALQSIARKHHLRLIYDSAHAFGCADHGVPLGGGGDAEVFSFHATKFVNAFEGGVITTCSDDIASRARLMRNFGFAGYDNVVALGINGKMTEVSAAMALTSLDAMPSIVKANRRNYDQYQSNLRDIPGVSLLPLSEPDSHNHQYVVAEIDVTHAGLTRNTLLMVLHAENILARRYFYPGCHRMQPYREWTHTQPLIVTERVCERVIVFPTGTAVTTDDIDLICQVVRLSVANGNEIERRIN